MIAEGKTSYELSWKVKVMTKKKRKKSQLGFVLVHGSLSRSSTARSSQVLFEDKRGVHHCRGGLFSRNSSCAGVTDFLIFISKPFKIISRVQRLVDANMEVASSDDIGIVEVLGQV